MGTGMDMEIKYGQGLEFDPGDGPDPDGSVPALSAEKEDALREIIREGFRAPVGPDEDICLVVDGRRCPVFNVSSHGIGVYLDELGGLENKTVMKGARLDFGSSSFPVDGSIVHISRDEAQYLVGIELLEPTEECRAALLEYIRKSRQLLFNR